MYLNAGRWMQLREKTMNQTVQCVKQLQERIMYLEDGRSRNNICVVGVLENTEQVNIEAFVNKLLAEALGLNIDEGFEIERTHTCGTQPKPVARYNCHILIKFGD